MTPHRPSPGEVALEGASRRNDFVELQDMNGASCGAKQARILSSYDSWSHTPPVPSATRGRHVDGLSRFRLAAALLQGVGVSGTIVA